LLAPGRPAIFLFSTLDGTIAGLALFLRLLKPGGRAAVIVPD
jgi:hypothetical protein